MNTTWVSWSHHRVRATPLLHVHETTYDYAGDADATKPVGMAAIYRDLVADDARTVQVADDVTAALNRGRHCLVLAQWTPRRTPNQSVSATRTRPGRTARWHDRQGPP